MIIYSTLKNKKRMSTLRFNPDSTYVELQHRLKYELDQPNINQITIDDIRKKLKRKFMALCQLSSDHHYAARDFTHKYILNVIEHGDVFDHVDYYQAKGIFIIVSQPYNIDMPSLRRLQTEYDFQYYIANEWSYYRPGETNFIIFEINPMTANLHRMRLILRKKYKDNDTWFGRK